MALSPLTLISVISLGIAAIFNVGTIVFMNWNWSKIKFTFVRTIQTCGHLFAAIVTGSRIQILLTPEHDSGSWIEVLFYVSNYLYYVLSNIYYVELLKAISVESKVLSKKRILIFQIFSVTFVAFGMFGTLLRFLPRAPWISQWNAVFGVVIMYSAIVAFVGSIFVYRMFSQVSTSHAGRPSVASRRFNSNTKALLIMFGVSQLVVAGAYSAGGALMTKPDAVQSATTLQGIRNAAGRIY